MNLESFDVGMAVIFVFQKLIALMGTTLARTLLKEMLCFMILITLKLIVNMSLILLSKQQQITFL